jgi:type I restriction enzyme S subunit
MSWKELEIGQVVELRQGLCMNKKSKHLLAETGLPLLRITDMIHGKQTVFIKEEVPERFIAKPDDIIYTRTGQVGLVFRQQYGVLFNNCFTVTPLNDELSKDYLYWFLRCDDTKKLANDYASGAAQLDLSHSAFKCIKIKYPTSLPTQRKIASILSAYDDLIETNLKRIKLLEEQAFVTYKLLDKIEKHKLSELYDTSSGGTPSRTNAEYFTGEINWFKSKELADSILLESEEKITEGAVDKSSAKLFPTGSVIMAMYGATIGKLGLLSMPSTTNQACCAIIEKDEIKSNYYILNWLLENREYVLSFRMGAAQENISQQVIKNLIVSVPKDADLKIFNSEMKSLYQLIKNIHQQNTKLREARDILLPKLMNGQVVV